MEATELVAERPVVLLPVVVGDPALMSLANQEWVEKKRQAKITKQLVLILIPFLRCKSLLGVRRVMAANYVPFHLCKF